MPPMPSDCSARCQPCPADLQGQNSAAGTASGTGTLRKLTHYRILYRILFLNAIEEDCQIQSTIISRPTGNAGGTQGIKNGAVKTAPTDLSYHSIEFAVNIYLVFSMGFSQLHDFNGTFLCIIPS